MRRLLPWLILLSVFAAFGGAAYRALRLRLATGKGMPEYSVLSEEDNGLSAAAEVLGKLGWQSVVLTRPVQHSESRECRDCLLILAEPAESSWFHAPGSDMSDLETKGILRWVERGNTLLLCGRHTTPLHRALDLFVESDVRFGEDVTSEAAVSEAGGYSEHIEKLVLEGHDVLHGAADALPLWWIDNAAGAAIIQRGKGRVIVVADPSLLTLRGLHRGDNLRFLVNVADLHAGDGKIYFDEYHHGLRSGGGFWGYLHYHGQEWTLPALGMVLAIAAWAVGMRLGRAVDLSEEKQADAVDYASALARIYERAGVQRRLSETLCRDFLAVLTRHVGLRRSVLPAEILAAWRRQHPHERDQELETLLRGVTALRGGAVSSGQLLTWTKSFDRFRTEVLRAG